MQETPEQYTRRIRGYLEGRDPVEVLAATPGRLARLIRGRSRQRLSRRPAPDTWSVTEILAHLADAELVYGVRIRFIVAAPGLPIQATEQDEWARVFSYAKQSPAESLAALRVNRAALLRLLGRLPRDYWDRYGVHSERGRETVTRVVELLAGHDLNHLRQIRERLAS